jgi:hypothetical protein
VRHGHWIDVNGDGSLWRCSVCGETQCCASNYCGDCGAKMDGEKKMRLIDVDKLKLAIDEALKTESKESQVSKRLTMKLLAGFAHTVLNEAPTAEAIPTDYLLTKSQEWLIDRSITGNEMKFIKDLIKGWENESRG